MEPIRFKPLMHYACFACLVNGNKRISMIEIRKIDKEEHKNLVQWNEGKDVDYLMQWAGRGYHYPISLEQIEERDKQTDSQI